MKMFLASALILSSACACALIWAQDENLGPQGAAVKMAPAPVISVTQGKAGTVPLSFRVARGYHINSNAMLIN